MPTFVIDALVAIVAILIGAAIGYAIARRALGHAQGLQLAEAEARMKQRIAEVESETKEKLLEAKEEAVKIRAAAENEAREARTQVQDADRRLHNREEHLERRTEEIQDRERELVLRERSVDDLRAQIDETLKAQLRELERVANMTRQEAQGIVMGQVEQDLRNEIARKVREAELQARDEGEKRARSIVTEAIQRVAADQTAESSVSVLPLPNEEIKGRIIGREGRNIRALQQATGIDLIVDDTPEAVVISGFDPIRREVARVALNKLIVDGRIHPARIEETVQKAREEVDRRVKEEGEAAVLELGLQGLHPEVVRHLGILRFRTSYGQQVLNHSKEVAYLAGMMASEIGADVRTARLSGLLHDIGKSIDHEVEGSHAVIGADLIQRHGVPQPVVARGAFAPLRGGAAHDRSAAPDRRGRNLGGTPGCAPRDARRLRQAAGEAGGDRKLLPWRPAVVRHPGRPGSPDPGQAGADRRRPVAAAGPGHRPSHRRRDELPRADPGDRGPRDPRRRIRSVK